MKASIWEHENALEKLRNWIWLFESTQKTTLGDSIHLGQKKCWIMIINQHHNHNHNHNHHLVLVSNLFNQKHLLKMSSAFCFQPRHHVSHIQKSTTTHIHLLGGIETKYLQKQQKKQIDSPDTAASSFFWHPPRSRIDRREMRLSFTVESFTTIRRGWCLTYADPVV